MQNEKLERMRKVSKAESDAKRNKRYDLSEWYARRQESGHQQRPHTMELGVGEGVRATMKKAEAEFI